MPRLAKLLLSCPDEAVKMNVAESLASITIFRDGCQQAVDHGAVKGVAQYLCATLPDIPTTRELAMCLLHLLRTLAAVTAYAQNGMRDVLGIGLIAKVIAFLGRVPTGEGIAAMDDKDSNETVHQALRLIWHVGNDPRGRKESLKADGVAVITDYLEDGDQKVREAAICALNVISLETQGKKDVLEHSVEKLSHLLHSTEETPYLHETCVQLCRAASELPAFRFAFARYVLSSIWLLQKVYGTTALAAVSPLLAKEEEQATREQAVHVVAHFLRTHPPARGDEIRVPPVAPLERIEQPALYAMEECVDIVENLLLALAFAHEPAMEALGVLLEVEPGHQEIEEFVSNKRKIDLSSQDRAALLEALAQ